MTSTIKEKTIFGFFWRFLQNIGTQAISFIVSIVLARILTPDDYGVVAMITVFTSIAAVFVTTGFSSSVIQKKDLTETDINTVFYCGLATAVFLYILLFFASPTIAVFYNEPRLVSLLRVQSLTLIISALFSTHGAILSREMRFKRSFIASLSGVLVQAIIGITLAYKGYGPWALVYSQLANGIACAIVMWIIVKWYPKWIFSWSSFRNVFAFSSKILGLGLVNTIFQNIQSLIIGRQYTSSDLAYYNRGSQFPQLLMQQVDGSMNTVLFSSLSKYQDDWDAGLRVLRHAMRTSLYICTPIMIGLCAIAEPLVLLLLTDKWLGCVPYVRLVAIICLFWPLSAQKNALNALGYSGIPLVMNLSSHVLTLILIIFTYKISVIVMVASQLFSSTIFLVIGSFVYRKYLHYGIKDQISDILPSLLLSLFMGVIVYTIVLLNLNPIATLFLQIIVGFVVYITLSYLFKLKSFVYLLDTIKSFIKNRHKSKRI